MKIRKRRQEGVCRLCQGHFVMVLPCCIYSMFFVASKPRSLLCFGYLSKVSWLFKIKTGAQLPPVEGLLTFPFPNCTVSYWQHYSHQGPSIWSITTWSLTICPIMRGFPPTVRQRIECSILLLVPLIPLPVSRSYLQEEASRLCLISTTQMLSMCSRIYLLDQQLCGNPSKPCFGCCHQWTIHTLVGSKNVAQQQKDTGREKVNGVEAFVHFCTSCLLYLFQALETFVVLSFYWHVHSVIRPAGTVSALYNYNIFGLSRRQDFCTEYFYILLHLCAKKQ